MCENRVSQLPPWAQNEIASLEKPIAGWEEISKSAMLMVKAKDKEIARLQANQGSKEGFAPPPATKQRPPSLAGPSALETKENTIKQEQTKVIENYVKKLQDQPVVHGTVRDILYDYAMRVNEILMDARDEKGNIDPSFEKQLLPKLVANAPYFAGGEWNNHVRKLPKGPLLDEFGRWILHAAENAHRWFYYITPCIVCGINSLCESLEECETFEEMDVNDRWKVVRENNLCKFCLTNHIGCRCKYEMPCGENGCTGKHHSMLHKNPQVNVF